MKRSYLLKTFLAVAILGTSYLPDAYAAFSFGNFGGFQDVTMNAADVGQSFTANWLCSANTTCNTPGQTTKTPVNLDATGTFTLISYQNTELTLSATIKNTTTSSFQAALMSIGLSASTSNPATQFSLPSLKTPGSVFTHIDSPGNIPGGFKNINACISSGKGCSGGAINSGLGDGYPKLGPSSDSFTFILNSNSGTIGSSVTLSDFAVKFQTGSPGDASYEFGDGLGPSPTPEPASFWLLGSALLTMFGLQIRKGLPKKS